MSNRISLRTVLIASLDLVVLAGAAPRRPPVELDGFRTDS